MSENRTRYAIVGTGSRARQFVDGLIEDYAATSSLVAMCDASIGRMDWYNEYLGKRYSLSPLPTYLPDDFTMMLAEQSVDRVIVATTDASHDTYCVQSMRAGCDVICEKPLTTDAAKARDILETREQTGRDLKVAFNVRYNPRMAALKTVIREGTIGRPLAIDFRYMLDTSHGADYFRRWHACREHSGGLLVHKSTHHFDIVNWLLDDWPESVAAAGDLLFYGRANANARGDTYNYERYTCEDPDARDDPFALRLDGQDPWMRRLYHEAESDSGYLRDRNVFGQHVDIDDVMHVLVRYRRGAMLNYSLVTFSPWEGFDLAVTGTHGRIELTQRNPPHVVNSGDARDAIDLPDAAEEVRCRVYPMFKPSYDLNIDQAVGGHDGADPLMRAALFAADPQADSLGCAAGVWDGVASILCGISANESIARGGHRVRCDDLIPLPTHPAFSPDHSTPKDTQQR